ncbi:uncharacterized [Tachysurus ichikawai]
MLAHTAGEDTVEHGRLTSTNDSTPRKNRDVKISRTEINTQTEAYEIKYEQRAVTVTNEGTNRKQTVAV